MKPVKASTLLPEKLLAEIQQYVEGETIYIPKRKGTNHKWGSLSGTRRMIDNRNREIRNSVKKGMTLEEATATYSLSIDSIKKIVYSKK